jgi:hypothetical protein
VGVHGDFRSVVMVPLWAKQLVVVVVVAAAAAAMSTSLLKAINKTSN